MILQILKWGLLIIILGLAVPFFQYSGLNDRVESFDPAPHNITPGVPIEIKIPALGISASVEQVAVSAEGLMDVPKNAMNVGWYNLGPLPGEAGSAVIDGHIDSPDGSRAVFSDLSNLKAEDKITVKDSQGKITSFTVTHSQNFNPDSDASSIFSSTDGLAHLNLITCSGVWNKNTNDYSQRLVVFADKE